ncbi:retrovirus-related pol polyprotein from transposon TNT 1-94 [Tanacetum coccineum]
MHTPQRKKKLCKAELEGPTFNLVKAFHKNSVFLQYQMDECHKLLTNKVDWSNPEGHQILRNIYEPLPLGGPPGQVSIQPQFFFNRDLDYLLTGDKERRIALSISKLKAARYLDFGLEELVPSLWVESEREYDISAVYGITHWWFRRKEFYINKHSESSDREAVRSHMRILSVISVKISEKDFKNLHPNDFEDLFLLNIQEKLNHLPKTDKTSLHTAVNMWIRNLVIRNRVGDLQLGIESYQTKVNLERPNWDAADYYFKEDYTIVPKPRAVVYRDRNNQRKLMRLNELHKFSDGTLTRVMEKLDQMVKDFHLFEYNKGMETRKWSEDDKRRSKDFITAIEKRLQIRRIYRSLESFVGGRAETRVQFLCCQNPLKMNADIEDRHLDSQWMQYTTLPQHSESFNKISVSFSRSLNTLSNKLSHYEFVDIEKGGADIVKMEMEMESVKASANSDVKYSFTSAQDGEPLQDDVRLCLGNDLKKAQDHTALNPCFNVSGVDYLIENISRDLEFQDDGFATRTYKKKARNDPTMSSEYEQYLKADFVSHLHPKDFATFDVLGFWKAKENQFPVLSRMAMDILSVQASSVASESAFSTSGRLLTIRRTRLTPESLEMCMCLKDHLDAQERKQDTSPLELPLDVEEGVFNVEVQQNEATQLTDQEIALDASSDGSSGEPRHDYMMSSGAEDDQTGDGHDGSMSHGYY